MERKPVKANDPLYKDQWHLHVMEMVVQKGQVVPAIMLLGILGIGVPAQAAGSGGPVAYYTFDKGPVGMAGDLTRNGNHAKIHGARYVTRGAGRALQFDGADDHVDCGNPPSLDIRDAVSIELWVKVLAIPPRGEPVVVGKGINSAYGLTYYKDSVGPTGSRLYFYVNNENTATPIALKTWQHIVATFDGETMRIYVNGEVKAEKRPASRKIEKGGPLLMGKGGFAGVLDDVKVFDRALTQEEVKVLYERTRQQNMEALKAMGPVQSLQGDSFTVQIGHRGAMDVVVGEERYRIESFWSYPGERIGTNAFSEGDAAGEASWRPKVSKQSADEIRIAASGSFYSLLRTVRLASGRISISDTVNSKSKKDVGVIIRHTVRTDASPRRVLLAGAPVTVVNECPENPTIFISQKASHLGVLAEDTLSRVHFEGTASGNEAAYSLEHIALRPGTTRSFRWAVYPLDGGADYFTFINRVRRDWKSNFTVEGPFEFGPPHTVWTDPERLRAYLKRKPLRIAAAGPWLDYDCFDSSTGRLMTREKYKSLMQKAMAAIKAADPEIKVVGNMEGPLVSLPQEVVEALYDALPPDKRTAGYPKPFTAKQWEIIKDLEVRQRDSLVFGTDGQTYYELYFRGPKDNRTPLMAILVYPAPGNAQLDFWMDQARFLMEEVGLDGIYLDGGGPVRGGRYGYDRWDGVTVDIDPGTGQITRRYTDFRPIMGDVPCRKLFDYVLARGGTFVANGHHYTEEMQSYRIPSFLETGGEYDPLAIPDGTKPPLLPGMCMGHLDSPIGLANFPGSYGEQAAQNYAKFVMKSVITHLRHGLLYYYYNTEVPGTGPGSGEYGPVNHMFPMTPIELHEGWILGKERIITARSIHNVLWEKADKPIVHLFDIKGREVKGREFSQIARQAGKWSISLKLNDWEEIAVVE